MKIHMEKNDLSLGGGAEWFKPQLRVRGAVSVYKNAWSGLHYSNRTTGRSTPVLYKLLAAVPAGMCLLLAVF